MSSASKVYEEAEERNEEITRRHGRFIPIVAATIAVCAALGTLAAQHRSIESLTMRNDAILTKMKASDQLTTYQTKRVRVSVYTTLLMAGLITEPKAKDTVQKSLDHEQASSLAVNEDAKGLENHAARELQQSERMMNSFVTLEVGTTLFEIAIVLSSISALTRSRNLLWTAIALSGFGVIFAVVGYIRGM
jgi:hypothetical protein